MSSVKIPDYVKDETQIEHFKKIENQYPIVSKSPDQQWEYKIEYTLGWGGFNLLYFWHKI